MSERQRGVLAPLSRESTASLIAEQIRTGITEGLFVPGQQMSEVRLAQQLNVSRGLLREAMQRLVQEGLLRSERYRGLFVVELDDNDLWDIYLAREAVERAAIRTLIRKHDPRALEPLAKIVRKMELAARSKRVTGISALDMQFHADLVEASGSPRLKRMMQSLLVETRMCLTRLEGHYVDLGELVAEHRRLVAALTDGDEEQALALLWVHMVDAVDRLVPKVDQPEEDEPGESA